MDEFPSLMKRTSSLGSERVKSNGAQSSTKMRWEEAEVSDQPHHVPRRRVGAVGNPSLLLQLGIALTPDHILVQPVARRSRSLRAPFSIASWLLR